MFPIIAVPDDAADLQEQLGTKPKFWFGDKPSLFKEIREGTGEDWSEKVASELAELLGIPHAKYDLALWKGRRGVVSDSFLPSGGRLIHGNELLAKIVPQYPTTKFFRVRQHSLRVVTTLVQISKPPIGFVLLPDVHTAVDVFIGYLMLDAWIGNQDRHHENWGLVLTKDGSVHLAPSYDHASCLGRIETDIEKYERLTTKDKNRTVEYYIGKASSAFYASPTSKKSLSTLDAFRSAARSRPAAGLTWLKRLEAVLPDQTEQILRLVPPDRISEVAVHFAQRMLELNRLRLRDCVKGLLA
jgi:hypothetical protein